MKVGFKINLRNYETLSVESSEYDSWIDCMRELYEFLKAIDHPEVKAFVKNFFSMRLQREMTRREYMKNED